MSGLKVKKGDTVLVLAGKDRGKTGEVLAAYPKDGTVVVAGVNVAKRHTKPTSATQVGGILDKEMPLPASNVAPVAKGGKPAKVGYKLNADGTKVRIDKRTGAEL
jgi:large subunit ribosomal protein L24